MPSRNATKAARLVALVNSIESGLIDENTVNMSDLARMFKVNRSTILRDFQAAQAAVQLSQKFTKMIADNPPTESLRKKQ